MNRRTSLGWLCVVTLAVCCGIGPVTLAAKTLAEVSTVRDEPGESTLVKVQPNPDGTPVFDGYLWLDDRIRRGRQLDLGGGFRLEVWLPTDKQSASGEVAITAITLTDGLYAESWTLSPDVDDRIARALREAEQLYGEDATIEEIDQILQQKLTDGDYASLGTLDQRLAALGLRDGLARAMEGEQLGWMERVAYLEQWQSGGDLTTQGCAGALGRTFTAGGVSVMCWTGSPLTGGLLGLVCGATSVAAVAAGANAWEECGGPCPWCGGGGGGGGGDDDNCGGQTPDCEGCDLDPGQVCNCYCPGQSCCDWPDAP